MTITGILDAYVIIGGLLYPAVQMLQRTYKKEKQFSFGASDNLGVDAWRQRWCQYWCVFAAIYASTELFEAFLLYGVIPCVDLFQVAFVTMLLCSRSSDSILAWAHDAILAKLYHKFVVGYSDNVSDVKTLLQSCYTKTIEKIMVSPDKCESD